MFNDIGKQAKNIEHNPEDMIQIKDMRRTRDVPNLTLFPGKKKDQHELRKEEEKKAIAAGVIQKVKISSTNTNYPSVS